MSAGQPRSRPAGPVSPAPVAGEAARVEPGESNGDADAVPRADAGPGPRADAGPELRTDDPVIPLAGAEPRADARPELRTDAGPGPRADAAAVARLLDPAGGTRPAGFEPAGSRLPVMSFRSRLTAGLVAAAVLPIAGFGLVVLFVTGGSTGLDATIARVLLLAIAIAVVFAVLVAYVLATDLSAPLRRIARGVERVSAGDLATRIDLPGDDEFARLAESHNRLAADLGRRNLELRRILDALESTSPSDRAETIIARAADQAREAFGMIDAAVLLVDPREIPTETRVPGEPRPVRAVLMLGEERLGVLLGHLPATRSWERADQDLLDLFARETAGAVRNAQLFARVDDQNRRLVELGEAKDDFLRGVSHNLQTPLARIRAYADQLAGERPDRRLAIVTEQADRLSRMVRQLMTVSRLESGTLHPDLEVLAVVPRVRRAWEALGAAEVPFQLEDHAEGWLAVADQDQLDQVLWALLDNAVGHGGGAPVRVLVEIESGLARLRVTVVDAGPGVAEADRGRLFQRFQRGVDRPSGEGSGLGLYVSRELCRSMGGDLVLAPAGAYGPGAAFTVCLPAEAAEES